jgi:hypothetical protein
MYTKFTKPATLDGKQLLAELNAGGVAIEELPSIDFNGDFWLNIDEADVSKATPIVAAHKLIPPVDNSAEKAALLAKLGITENEAALLLGGN